MKRYEPDWRGGEVTPIEHDDATDKIDGLTSDLEGAVEVAFKRGATEWVRLNYPKQYETLIAQKESQNG